MVMMFRDEFFDLDPEYKYIICIHLLHADENDANDDYATMMVYTLMFVWDVKNILILECTDLDG